MFYLPVDQWSPRYIDPPFFTFKIESRTLLTDSPETVEFLKKFSVKTNHPAIYFKVEIFCGKRNHIFYRRYSQFRKLYDFMLEDPPLLSSISSIDPESTYQPLFFPPKTCPFYEVSEEFLDDRQRDLADFLQDLLIRPGFAQHPVLKIFLELNHFAKNI